MRSATRYRSRVDMENLETRQFLSASLTLSPSATALLFKPPKLFANGTNNNGALLLTGDFNGDKKLDVASLGGFAVSVKLGDGQGGLDANIDTALNGLGNRFAVGKFNADKFDDLVVSTTSGVFIFLANGDGTFTTSTLNIGLNKSSVTVQAADLNGDKKVDVVVGCVDAVQFLAGNGDGTFKPAKTIFNGGFRHILALGDFNKDKKIDIVDHFQGAKNFQWLINKGNGKFAATGKRLEQTGDDIVTADFNGDKKLDTAYAMKPLQGVVIFLGNGKGGVQKRIAVPKITLINRLFATDVSRDGKVDLIVITPVGTKSVLSFMLGTGKGAFKKPVPLAVKINPAGIVFGFFNADKKLDGVAGFDNGQIGLLLGP